MGEYHWEKALKNREEAKKTLRSGGLGFHISWFIGVIFAILGIIAGATDGVGLEATEWFLLAIVVLLLGLPMYGAVLAAARLLGLEGESKKEE